MCRIMKALIAFADTGFTLYSSIGVANIMYLMFALRASFEMFWDRSGCSCVPHFTFLYLSQTGGRKFSAKDKSALGYMNGWPRLKQPALWHSAETAFRHTTNGSLVGHARQNLGFSIQNWAFIHAQGYTGIKTSATRNDPSDHSPFLQVCRSWWDEKGNKPYSSKQQVARERNERRDGGTDEDQAGASNGAGAECLH